MVSHHSNRSRDHCLGQSGAAVKNGFFDGGHGSVECYRCQTGTMLEEMSAQRGHSIWQSDRSQGSAAFEGPALYVRHAFRDGNRLQRRAAGKGALSDGSHAALKSDRSQCRAVPERMISHCRNCSRDGDGGQCAAFPEGTVSQRRQSARQGDRCQGSAGFESPFINYRHTVRNSDRSQGRAVGKGAVADGGYAFGNGHGGDEAVVPEGVRPDDRDRFSADRGWNGDVGGKSKIFFNGNGPVFQRFCLEIFLSGCGQNGGRSGCRGMEGNAVLLCILLCIAPGGGRDRQLRTAVEHIFSDPAQPSRESDADKSRAKVKSGILYGGHAVRNGHLFQPAAAEKRRDPDVKKAFRQDESRQGGAFLKRPFTDIGHSFSVKGRGHGHLLVLPGVPGNGKGSVPEFLGFKIRFGGEGKGLPGGVPFFRERYKRNPFFGSDGFGHASSGSVNCQPCTARKGNFGYILHTAGNGDVAKVPASGKGRRSDRSDRVSFDDLRHGHSGGGAGIFHDKRLMLADLIGKVCRDRRFVGGFSQKFLKKSGGGAVIDFDHRGSILSLCSMGAASV